MTITGISSMATRAVLADLAAAFERRTGCGVAFESVGGVDAAKRVEAGEPFDVVVLASDALDRLLAAGHVVPGTRVDVTQSGVAVAVPADAPRPDIASEEAVRRAVLAARRIGYSTGPSGTELNRLFARWGIAGEVAPRMVQARAGVPVAALVASGEADLGFQQYAEMMSAPGIAVLGTLPPPIAIVTTFAGGVSAAAREPAHARELLAFLASPDAADAKRRHGMQPA